MKRLIHLFEIIGLSALVLSCTRFEIGNPETDFGEQSLMRFSASYPLEHTRANDSGFIEGDQMGVFVVDYYNGESSYLQTTGNRADNVCFTYDEASMSWSGATDIYWKDNQTPVDIYGYYPYNPSLSSVTDYRFSVSNRQDIDPSNSDLGGYEASDLLWAKSENIHPTTDKVTLTYGHLMAGVTVSLQMGNGFKPEEWRSLDKAVLVTSTATDASVNFETGSVIISQNTDKNPIKPRQYNDEYRAVVVPQVIEAGSDLLHITVDGISYSYSRQDIMTYLSGKMHMFTIKVDKRSLSGDYEFTLVNQSVLDWEDDLCFHEEKARSYIVIHVENPGTLSCVLDKKGLDAKTIVNLKLTGFLNHEDLHFLGYELTSLQHLNIKDIKIVGNAEEEDVLTGFGEVYTGITTPFSSSIQKIIMPDSIKKIGDFAFAYSHLTGSLIIPDGVEEIGYYAFMRCNLTGTLSLPSTLKVIKGGAFAETSLSGNLILPEGLKIIGPRDGAEGGQCELRGAFQGTNFTGFFSLPSSLVEFNGPGLEGLTGHITIPAGIKHITEQAFLNSSCTSVTIPEGIRSIGTKAFMGSSIQGELVIPSTCKYLYEGSFSGSKINGVIFPDDLKYIGANAFENCGRLSETVIIPKGVKNIFDRVFNGCNMLSGVVLHENISSIGELAFAYCHNLNYFVCMAEEPPYLEDNTFEGVPRDNFIIQVPAGSVGKYKNADGWREFKRIAEYSNFACRPAATNALNSAHCQTLVLNADGPWAVSYLPEWCAVSPESGHGKTEVTLNIEALSRGSGHRADSVVFTLDDGGYKTWCKVSQYDYEYNIDEVIPLQKATMGNGIDVVFVGDGWDGESISNGDYLELVQNQMEHFFDIEPYTTYRDYFNVYALVALSQEKGINTLNAYRDTKFMTIYGGGNCSGIKPHLSVVKDVVFDYVTKYSPVSNSDLCKSLVILVPNSKDYGGCTQIYGDGSTISICCPSELQYPNDTRGIIQHEAGGHGFGKLADEKVLVNLFSDAETKDEIRAFHDRGWYKNVSVSVKTQDVPWSHFIFDPEYSDYVDVFEGAMGYSRGVWRSEQNSCMNLGIPYYNAISRQEIVRRILDYSGEGFTMDKFYANDSKKWGGNNMQTTAMPDQPYVKNSWHTTPYFEQ